VVHTVGHVEIPREPQTIVLLQSVAVTSRGKYVFARGGQWSSVTNSSDGRRPPRHSSSSSRADLHRVARDHEADSTVYWGLWSLAGRARPRFKMVMIKCYSRGGYRDSTYLHIILLGGCKHILELLLRYYVGT